MDPLEGFEFSQSSLQDFVDCRQRFYLRYIRRLAWPALQAEPARENEAHMRRGERFHRLAQQYLLGVPPELLARMAEADEDASLRRWWQNFLESIPPMLGRPGSRRHVEATLAARLDCFRLVGKYDLVVWDETGCFTIYDWKTSARRPKSQALRARLQSRVYPYLLVQAGASLNCGRGVDPARVEMVYWFADPDYPPERIEYSLERCQEDECYLVELVNTARSLPADGFEMCAGEAACRFCVYRSLCDRGCEAGDAGDDEYVEDYERAVESLEFDLEQIAEIDF